MKYKSILAAAVLALSMQGLTTSCTDDLDMAPDGSLTREEILQDPVKVGGLLASCYRYIPQKGYTYSNFEPLPVSLSDDAWSSDDGYPSLPVSIIYNNRQNAESHPLRDTGGSLLISSNAYIGKYWPNYWHQIYEINALLADLPRANVDNETRDRYTAEAKLLRAFFYSELVRWFGKVPVVTEAVDITQADATNLRRQPVKEVVDFIIQDCDDALNTAALPWRITSNAERMRCTKALACAIKSRMSVVAASPLFCEGQNYWQWAYEINKKALEQLLQNGYQLFAQTSNPNMYGTRAGSAYRELAAKNADYSASPRDRETIWSHSIYGGHWLWHIGYIGSGMNNTAYCKSCPTQELVDAYETIDGKPVLDLGNPYLDEKHLNPNYNPANTLYDPKNPYANRDPRFYETILYNGANFIWDNKTQTVESFLGGRHTITSDPSDRTRTRTGYFVCKIIGPKTAGGTGDNMAADNSGGDKDNKTKWKFFRLAEIYLNLAEAAAEAGQLGDARIAANAVRSRVNMPDLPVVSKEETILRIHNERRVELAWEEHRYFDLRRWQNPDGDLKQTCAYLTKMEITKNPDGSFTYERKNIWDKERGGCSNRDLLLPLSTAEAARLKNVTGQNWQNPGW